MSRDCRRRPAVVAASRPWKASTRAVGAALVAVPLLPVAAGCDWLRPGGPPEDATIYVSSQDVDEATLIVASDFDQVPGGGVCDEPGVPCPEPFQLRRADTTLVDLPYTYDFEFTSKQRLYAVVFPDVSVRAWMSMRVEINGNERFNGLLEIGPEDEDGNRERLQYAYFFTDLR